MQRNNKLTDERLAHIHQNLKRWAAHDAALNSYISGKKIDPIFHDCVEALEELQAYRGTSKKPAYYVLIDGDDVEFNSVDEFSCGRTGGTPLYTNLQPIPTLHDERQAFERWLKCDYSPDKSGQISDEDECTFLALLWYVWQARAALQWGDR